MDSEASLGEKLMIVEAVEVAGVGLAEGGTLPKSDGNVGLKDQLRMDN